MRLSGVNLKFASDRLNITEFRTHLSKYLPALEAGETILLSKRNEPIAEIRGLPGPPTARREDRAQPPDGRFVECLADALRNVL
jgi:antitoxin (DNA-binding transcriptional repressor) of toxin-antitoxin stability system